MRTLESTARELARRWAAPLARQVGELAAAALLLCACVPAVADDGVLYARGKAYTLDRSTKELAVKLQDREVPVPVSEAMSLRGLGTLDEPDGGRSRYRLLQVGAANELTRDAAGAIPGVDWVRGVYRIAGTDAPLLATGQIVVRVAPHLGDAEVRDTFSGYGLRVIRPVEGLHNAYLLGPDDDPNRDLVDTAAALCHDDRVLYAHPDFAMRPLTRQISPQDTYFSEQWHLNNTGQGGGTPGADIGVMEAWLTSQGEDVRVGMFDDCCDVAHEDLTSNYLNVGQDIIEGDGNPEPGQEGDRHGTSVMGLICAAGNNVGVRGVAPNARFTASRGINGFVTISEMASVYTFARQQNVDVHSNSWGFAAGIPVPDLLADAIQVAFEEGRDGKGMVILFASGNDGRDSPEDMSGLPTVIAVGATNANDVRSSYSNYGSHLDVMAPSNFGEEATTMLPSIVTTDNTDDAGFADLGYNINGFDLNGFPNLANPNYTQDFGGTSAACPVTAGVAALVVSVNPALTATQVRVLLEHTADRVSPGDAAYDGVTGHSIHYGYGRVDAAAAVEAASESVDNGNLTWPDRVSGVSVLADTLSWTRGSETQNIIIVRADEIFQWVPTNGTSYSVGDEVTAGVTVVFKDTEGETNSYSFEPPDFGTAYLAIFAQNNLGRYSWGVLVDSDGNVTGAGPGEVGTGEDTGGDEILPIAGDPKVSIDVFPRAGVSPLTVTFQGNALTDSEIASATWDFGDGSPPVEEHNTTHEYIVTDGTTKTFIATFTVVDADGDVGDRSAAIEVASSDLAGDGGESAGTVRITVADESGDPIEAGYAPLTVSLSLETEDLPGEFNSVMWDLGDGATADTLTVVHTYTFAGQFGITATVTTCAPAPTGCRTSTNPNGMTWQTTSQAEFIDVLSSATNGGTVPPQDDEQVTEPGAVSLSTGHTASGAVCGIGLLPLWLGMLAAALTRRWRGGL